MREILFRGKKSSTNEWVFGSLIFNKSNGLHTITQITENPVHTGVLQGWCYGVLPQTVGQFTGLKDKNGVKIFEGDIIPYSEDDSINLIVEWSNDYLGYFVGLGLGETIEQPLFDFLFPEVIGNIHDNPELIKL